MFRPAIKPTVTGTGHRVASVFWTTSRPIAEINGIRIRGTLSLQRFIL